MKEILPVAQLGHPILRKQAQRVENDTNPGLETLIKGMLATIAKTNGVGLAAPQIFHPYRLFVIASRPNERYPNAPLMEPTVMINPRLLAGTGEVKGWEGCLSIPGWRGLVPRCSLIEIEYLSLRGQLQRRQLQDFVARIFQHELDHLDGLVFLDRLESTADLYTEQEYQQLVTHQP